MKPPGIFLTAEWRSLLMLNYVVDPGVLQSRVPTGTELDLWQGRAYVSVVGFRFLRTRVLGIPVPFHRDFDEVNLRFYVRRQVAGEWRKGVVFVKEIVPRRAIAFVARTIYGENYVRHPMRHALQNPGRVSFEWYRQRNWEAVRGTTVGEPYLPGSNSEETFITEHYWGYARQSDGTTVEYGVEHPPWKVQRCEQPEFTAEVDSLYGADFVPFLKAAPASAFLAEGSPVVVRRGIPLV